MAKKKTKTKTKAVEIPVESLRHRDKRKNIPTEELRDFVAEAEEQYEDNKRVRVAGPFTVESLSPHRTISVEEKQQRVEVGDASPSSAQWARR